VFDEISEHRGSLVASSVADPTGVAMLFFSNKGHGSEMVSFIGTHQSGAVAVRDESGAWKEMS
jgi:hypothetical protein